jgi:hypothetical protein
MAAKKPTKKPAAKTAPAKKPATKKPAAKTHAAAFAPKARAAKNDTRRPKPNPPLSDNAIKTIGDAFAGIREILEAAAANMRQLDRKRLNGVGIKKQGFIEGAIESAALNQQFLPPYLDLEKFEEDFEYFLNLKSIHIQCEQLKEFIWNLVSQSADISYTDSLEYYASVREAANRRIDGAESLYRYLEPFFKRPPRKDENGQPIKTQKKLKRDINALEHGSRDGKIVIEHISPKVIGGVHKVIDESFSDSESFKETLEGEIKE